MPPGVVRVPLAELADALAVFVRELRRKDELHRHVEIAGAARGARDALPREPDGPAVLRLGRDAQRDAALERGHRDLRSEHRLLERHRQLHSQIVTVAREERMWLHVDAQIEVARRRAVRTGSALPREPDALSVANAGRDLDREAARLAARLLYLDLLVEPFVGLGQRQLEVVLDVLPRRRPRTPSSTRGAAEEIFGRERPGHPTLVAEERPEEIRERALVGAHSAAARLTGVDPVESAGPPATVAGIAREVRPDLVVALALLRVDQDLVGLVDLLEALLG